MLPRLRTYWYDGATDAISTLAHKTVTQLSGVKLWLGRLTAHGQKGVDPLIVRDLITLAHQRGITSGVLVRGDEDLREGVREAQEWGMHMSIVGIPSSKSRLAPTLINEADDVHAPERFRAAVTDSTDKQPSI